jgi:hypothetical protein
MEKEEKNGQGDRRGESVSLTWWCLHHLFPGLLQLLTDFHSFLKLEHSNCTK